MMVVITYDVSTQDATGARRLRRVAKACVDYGQRVQNSVFEFVGDAATFEILKARLLKLADLERDSLRFYRMGNSYGGKIEHYGAKAGYDPEGFMAF